MAITVGVLTGGSNNHETSSEEGNGVATDFVNEGVVGDITNTNGVAPATGGFAVNAQGTPAMAVDVSAGVAYVQATPTSQSSQVLRVKNSATDDVTISANSSGSTKYDWVYISISASAAANPAVGADDVATLVTSRSSSASTDDGSPPTYGYPLAVVTVANGASSITNANIRDIRGKVVLETGLTDEATGWLSLGFTPDTVTNNGNRSYDLVFNSTDLTDTLSPGMRLRTTRTVTAPTQCTDLELGSTQYWSRASASLSGITFTDDFTVMAWIKLESYGTAMWIASRFSTNGWLLGLSSAGQLRISGVGGGNTDTALTYQSVPLGRWVHVAATLDMSGATATTYIDGVSVPNAYTNGASSSLTQSGDLVIGAYTGGTEPFDGKIAQVGLFNAVLSAATIRSYMSQTLSGSETNCIGCWTFNGNGNDSDANANNLTAQGSATATNADSPFADGANLASGYTDGTTEFGIVTAVSFSTNTTVTVQVPENCAIPTSGGVSAVAYSTQKVPYGFVGASGRWDVTAVYGAQVGSAVSISSLDQWFSLNARCTVPIGAWTLGYSGSVQPAAATSVSQWSVLLAPATPTNAVRRLELCAQVYTAATLTQIINMTRRSYISLSSATEYLLYGEVIVNSGATTMQVRGDLGMFVIKAELSLL